MSHVWIEKIAVLHFQNLAVGEPQNGSKLCTVMFVEDKRQNHSVEQNILSHLLTINQDMYGYTFLKTKAKFLKNS